jgi:hypothetical protein
MVSLVVNMSVLFPQVPRFILIRPNSANSWLEFCNFQNYENMAYVVLILTYANVYIYIFRGAGGHKLVVRFARQTKCSALVPYNIASHYWLFIVPIHHVYISCICSNRAADFESAAALLQETCYTNTPHSSS